MLLFPFGRECRIDIPFKRFLHNGKRIYRDSPVSDLRCWPREAAGEPKARQNQNNESFFHSRILLHSCSPSRTDHVQVARTGEAVVLPHVIDIDRKFLCESFVNADRETISGKALEDRIVESLVADEPFRP